MMNCFNLNLHVILDAVVLNESKGAKFHKAHPVPYAIQKRVESAVLEMEKDGYREGFFCC
jgi:hypothetical protein